LLTCRIELYTWPGIFCIRTPADLGVFKNTLFNDSSLTLRWRWMPLIPALLLLTSCSTDPEHEKVKYLESGNRYFKSGKFSEAAIQFQNAVELDPRFADAYYGMAQANLKTGNVDAAFTELVQATTLNPSNVSAQLELGRLQIVRRKYADAEATARRVISTSTSSANRQCHRPHAPG
jgi:Tfp pilus assembly protein PilF